MWSLDLPGTGAVAARPPVELVPITPAGRVAMDGTPSPAGDPDGTLAVEFPDGLTTGSTVLVAGTREPSLAAVCLRALHRYGRAGDGALVVTTADAAGHAIETYERLPSGTGRPSLGLVDTSGGRESVSAPYGDQPVLSTPSPGDLERLVVALSDLSRTVGSPDGTRHLVVRSLTPILDAAATDHVCTVLERITGLRSADGLCLLGVDYTAHDEVTMEAVAETVDGVLWVTRSDPDRLGFEYRPTRGRLAPTNVDQGRDG
ncbi:DUF7504 family protein [Halorarum halobium]|uniref:DUF7504 family protein n=1 Tax=Halorarum halobium TaxID=3075121 RepID=UPI0028B09175|nr:hypothetical protein [Halobaculum sp. XH14]